MALDHQQALLLDVLRRACGERVSYEELRGAGVEYPASVVSELELAGLPLERCSEGSSAACRLPRRPFDERCDELPHRVPGGRRRGHGPTVLPDGPARAIAGIDIASAGRVVFERTRHALARLVRHAPVAREAAGRAASARRLAPGALIAAGAAVAAITILAVGELADKGQTRHAETRRQARSITPTARRTRPGSAPLQPVPSTPPTQVSPALAAQLEARGHELLQADEPKSAVPVLKEALAATGESLDSCVEPASETCLTYAYALYDLGTALRLDRHPVAAVPILEQRLQIANQRPTVQDELQLARQEAGRRPAVASTPG